MKLTEYKKFLTIKINEYANDDVKTEETEKEILKNNYDCNCYWGWISCWFTRSCQQIVRNY